MALRKTVVLGLIVLILTPLAAWTATIELDAVTFPERKTIKLDFAATNRAPNAEVTAKVKFEESQAEVEVNFKDMKPAVLFGGDVTCYVVWAVLRDGAVENIGELWMPENKGRVELATALKSFALMITAEPYGLVVQPSELVLFFNRPTDKKQSKNDHFSFDGFAPPPEVALEAIKNVAWDSDVPLDIHQAEKAFELAGRSGAESYARPLYRDAKVALGQARNLASASKHKTRIDYSRRSIALSSEAIQMTIRRKEAEELERQLEARRAEMAELDERANVAEKKSLEAEKALAEARLAIESVKADKAAADAAVLAAQTELTRIGVEQEALVAEKAELSASMLILRQEGEDLRVEAAGLRQESERLRQEREELAGRLEGALSHVADTQSSARGIIVNLPDILFDTSKATLKHEAQVVIAKMAGILLIMPELNLRVEGHTDSQGSDEYNQRLSEQRADSVKDFLETNGIDNGRMAAVGYGETRPVDDNTTSSGRQKNRRVEIIISEGEIKGAED